ncbi:NEL-type E3 ubiquitin ligase domain-containing protein [Pseudomonas sp. App30]|uniref:dermonecrotic toxin domain-containing protein n=1 Tax=Pseudomonas sp. App30 TaxID=3068990 RepID=UPI003A7FB877
MSLDLLPDERTPHRALIEAALPGWLVHAPAALRQRFFDSSGVSFRSTAAARPLMARLQAPAAFCAPLLQAELDRQYPALKLHAIEHELVRMTRDVDALYSRLRPQHQTLLEAAMQNFAPGDAQSGGFERGSVILPVGVFTFEITDKGTLRYTYPQSKVVDLTPDAFAGLCRSLDLGKLYQAHIEAVCGVGRYKAPSQDLAPQKQRTLLKFHLRDRLEVEAVTAFMKGDLSETAYQMLLQFTQPQSANQVPMWDGQKAYVEKIRLLRTRYHEPVELLGALCISRRYVDKVPGPCVVYLPGDPDQPLKQYPNRTAFEHALREKLRDRGYQRYFERFLDHQRASGFFERLNNSLTPPPVLLPGQFPRPGTPDPEADIGLVLPGQKISLTRVLFKMYVDLVQRNALAQMVPTAQHDEQARRARVAWWQSAGLNLLNLAAFAVPGVGALMAVVGAEQLVRDLCVGVDDWQHGQTEEAMAHFASVAESLAMVAAGVLGGVAIARSPFMESLVPVADSSGAASLIHPDLAPYASDLALPAALQPNAQGQYEINGGHYITLDDQLYQQAWDPRSQQWLLEHPRLAGRYRPVLRHNGGGGWQHVLEDPLQWEGATLMRRFGPLTDGFTDKELFRMRRACGVADRELRALHVNRAPMPALLEDTLTRLRGERQVDVLVEQLAGQRPLGEGSDYVMPLLARLQPWPRSLGLSIALEDGRVLDYRLPGEGGGRVVLRREDWLAGEVAPQVLRQLTPGQRAELLPQVLGTTIHAQAAALADALALQAERARVEIVAGIVARQQPRLLPAAEPLRRDFPGLPVRVANEIAVQATEVEFQQLSSAGKVPTRLGEQARLELRELRLNRAMEGLVDGRRPSPDRDVLVFGFLDTLAGWPADIRFELVSETLSPLAAAEPEAASQVIRVVRREGVYQAFDTQAQPLSPAQDLFEVIAQALPPAVRQAMDISSAKRLRLQLLRQAATRRERAALLLGQRRVRPWFQAPTRQGQHIGYVLSGRGQAGWWQRMRVRRLFPWVGENNQEELFAWIRSRHVDFEVALTGLEQELRVLERSLDEWMLANTSPDQGAVRIHFRQELLGVWRWENRHLRLSGWRGVGELPVLTAQFPYARSLGMARLALEEDPSAFLRQFPNVTDVALSDNRLTQIPAALGSLQRLRVVRLDGNVLEMPDDVFEGLFPEGRESAIARLELDFAFRTTVEEGVPQPRALSATALAPLRRARELRWLDLSSNAITLDDAAFEVLGELDTLVDLRLRRTWVDLNATRQAALARLVNLRWLDLSDNFLIVPPDVGSFHQLRTLGLWNSGLLDMPPGLDTLLERNPMELRDINLGDNQMVDVGPLPVDVLAGLGDNIMVNFNGNPWSTESLATLRAARIGIVGPELAPAPRPALSRGWLEGAAADLVARSEADRLLPEAQNFYRVLDQVPNTHGYTLDPNGVRRRMWALVDAVVPAADALPGDGLGLEDLRTQLLAQADLVIDTCGDGISTLVDELETTLQAWQAASSAIEGGEAMIDPLAHLGWRLFRQRLVDDLARLIEAARERRRTWLWGIGPEAPLEPLDDISDEDLLDYTPDEVEMRLYLRHALVTELRLLPQPPRLYAAHATEAMIARVATAVRMQDTPAAFGDWLVQQPFWNRYWRQVRPAPFTAVQQRWDNVLTAFLDATSEAANLQDPAFDAATIVDSFDLSGADLEEAVAVLGEFTSPLLQAPIPWRNAEGVPQHLRITLSDGVELQIYDWFREQQRLQDEAELLRVTQEWLEGNRVDG